MSDNVKDKIYPILLDIGVFTYKHTNQVSFFFNNVVVFDSRIGLMGGTSTFDPKNMGSKPNGLNYICLDLFVNFMCALTHA